MQVAKDRFQIGYIGPADFTEIQAKKMAMLRAAELTRIAGARWFRILSEESSSRQTRLTTKEVVTSPERDSMVRTDGRNVVIAQGLKTEGQRRLGGNPGVRVATGDRSVIR
ncbi:MAG: hypothetical protein ABIW76_01415 [Fibrobacteria bacterium]